MITANDISVNWGNWKALLTDQNTSYFKGAHKMKELNYGNVYKFVYSGGSVSKESYFFDRVGINQLGGICLIFFLVKGEELVEEVQIWHDQLGSGKGKIIEIIDAVED